MKVFFTLLLLLSVTKAQTNVLYCKQQSINGPVAGNATLTLVYPPPPRSINGVIQGAPLPIVLSINGEFWLTNVPWGTYNLSFDSGLFFQFPVATNTLGSNNIAVLASLTVPYYPSPYYLLNGSSTIFVTLTNGPGIKIVAIGTNIVNGFTNVSYQVSTN